MYSEQGPDGFIGERADFLGDRRAAAVKESLDAIERGDGHFSEHAQTEGLGYRRVGCVEHSPGAVEILPCGARLRMKTGAGFHVGGVGGAFGAFETTGESVIRE